MKSPKLKRSRNEKILIALSIAVIVFIISFVIFMVWMTKDLGPSN